MTTDNVGTYAPPRCCSYCQHPTHFPSEPYGLYWVCAACGKETQREIQNSSGGEKSWQP